MHSLSEEQLKNLLKSATDAALAGGEILRKYWGKLTSIREKTFSGDLVTEADHESEMQIVKILHSHYPDHAILGEESGQNFDQKSAFLWCVDPLDGTTNYTHQFPMVSVSIGLLYHQEPVVGVVYNPIFNELFQAAQGMGSLYNGQKIHVSKVSELSKSLLVTGFPYNRRETSETNYPEFFHLTHLSQGVRRIGSAAIDLAYIAAGRLDGYWEKGLKIWDMAAGVVLVREAGGKVTAHDLTDFNFYSRDLLATNGIIHDALSEHLQTPEVKIIFTKDHRR